MTRLIDADALLDEWLKQKDPTFKCGEMETFFEDMCSKWIDILHDAPTVDVIGQCEGCIYERPHGEWLEETVVRCKDCLNYNGNGNKCNWGMKAYDDAYCSHGHYDDGSTPILNCADGELAEQTDYKLSGCDEVIEALDNLNLEFTIHGKERIKRIKEGDND